MGKYFAILLFVLFNVFQAQGNETILESYPRGQLFYLGGYNGMQAEMIKLVKDKKFSPCSRTDEVYYVKVLIRPDASISYVKDFDTVDIQKNKCAFDFSRKIIPHLENWIPAKIDGQAVKAIVSIKIDPFFLYYSKDDPQKNIYKNPRFKKGLNVFSSKIAEVFERSIQRNEDNRTVVRFVVNEKGLMEDFEILGNYSEVEKRNIITDLSQMKGEWEPATFNDIPRKTRMSQPIIQAFSLELEKEMMDKQLKNVLNR